MSILEDLRKKVVGVLSKAKDSAATALSYFDPLYGNVDSIPDDAPENKDKLASYCDQLIKDSQEWRKSSMAGRMRKAYTDITEFWSDARKLIGGNHWEVWGRRNEGAGEEWKAELQDDEIANQIRTKVNYITSQWHDVIVHPNIGDVNAILDQERGKAWMRTIRAGGWKTKIEGTAHFKTILSYDDNPKGAFKEVLLDNEGVFPTPFATGLSKEEGCWYFAHASMVDIRDMIKIYPELDQNRIAVISSQRMRDITIQADSTDNVSLSNTKLTDRIQFFLDDDSLIDAVVDEEEIARRVEIIKSGGHPQAQENDNHLAFIQAYHDIVQNLYQQIEGGSQQQGIPEDMPMSHMVPGQMPMEQPTQEQQPSAVQPSAGLIPDEAKEELQIIANIFLDCSLDHEQMIEMLSERGIPIGKISKYPNGRMVTTVSGIVAEDVPNPYLIPWRMLFHKWENESIPGSYWGRSDVEILYDVNKTEDQMLSRIADITLISGIPKTYFSIADKQEVEKNYSNDPTEPGFFKGTPPVFRSASAPRELFELYNTAKQDAAKRLGVNEISYGESPSSNASGALVRTLIRQNEPQIAGEANANLNDVVESMIRTRIALMKEFYKEPRNYYVDGQFKTVNVSRLLSYQQISGEDGGVTESEIPSFEISVKPNSNFPNEWESELQFLVTLWQQQLIPAEAIYDSLSQRYPKLSRNGEYYQMSEALKIGMQMMAQQEAKKKEEEADLKKVGNKVKQEGIKQLLGQSQINNIVGYPDGQTQTEV